MNTKKLTFQTTGTCSRQIDIELKGDLVESVCFTGGCNGNLQGIGLLVKGMSKDEVITRLRGVDCKGRGTSCPDQLAIALESMPAE